MHPKVEGKKKKLPYFVPMLIVKIPNLFTKKLPKVSTRYCLVWIPRNRKQKDIRIVNSFIRAKQKQKDIRLIKQPHGI